MEVNLPHGDTFLKYATIVSQSSPFIYLGNKTRSEVLEVYRSAVDFGISQLGKSQLSNPQSLLAHLMEQSFASDAQENLLIVFDFLVQDYVLNHYQMSATELKSAISAFDLQEDPEFLEIIEKIVENIQS